MPDCIPNYLNSILNYINIESVFALGLLSPGTHALSHHLLAFIHSFNTESLRINSGHVLIPNSE